VMLITIAWVIGIILAAYLVILDRPRDPSAAAKRGTARAGAIARAQ
jgi:hypothetical protein